MSLYVLYDSASRLCLRTARPLWLGTAAARASGSSVVSVTERKAVLLDTRSNYERTFTCETCRYFSSDFLDPFIGKCHWNTRPHQTDVFRPACHHHAGDIEAPEYFPPLLTNDRVCVDSQTGEVFHNEESERAEKKFQNVIAWNNFDVMAMSEFSESQEKMLEHLDELKEHIKRAKRPEVASGLRSRKIDWTKVIGATDEEYEKARTAESLATTADPDQMNG